MLSRLGSAAYRARSAPISRSTLSIQSSSNTSTHAYRLIQPTRTASSSSKHGPKNTSPFTQNSKGSKSSPVSEKPPEINFDHRQGNSILHQKAARAAELHAELNTLLETQAQRRADEANRHLGAGFVDFVRSSKSELINIFAAFTCVLLAWQIAAIRKGARKLIDSAEETNQKMEEFKQALRILSSDEFLERVSVMYRDELKEREESQSQSVNTTNRRSASRSMGGWLGQMSRKESSRTASSEGEVSEDILTEILKRELTKVIGDKALSSAELEERKLLQLQKEMGIVQEAQKLKDPRPEGSSDSLGGLEHVFTEIQNEDESGRKVVKRSKGFI